MVALLETFALEKPDSETKNRVGDFFSRSADRAGENSSLTLIVVKKNGLSNYDACRAASLSQSAQGEASRGSIGREGSRGRPGRTSYEPGELKPDTTFVQINASGVFGVGGEVSLGIRLDRNPDALLGYDIGLFETTSVGSGLDAGLSLSFGSIDQASFNGISHTGSLAVFVGVESYFDQNGNTIGGGGTVGFRGAITAGSLNTSQTTTFFSTNKELVSPSQPARGR